MNKNVNHNNQNQDQQDQERVSPEISQAIYSASMQGDETMPVTYLYRSTYSAVEFLACCELAEGLGLKLTA